MGHLWGYQTIVKYLLTGFKLSAHTGARARNNARPTQSLSLLLMLLALGGCAGADVAVQSTRLPVPVIEPLPVSLGIHLSDELRSYVHQESIKDSGSFRINVGAAQELMFDNLASGLFRGHRFAASPTDHTLGTDAILVPSINELQFSIPKQTKSDFFEVWLKYNFELFAPDGSTIAEWPLQAYGRANARNYGFLEDTDNGALQEASRVALRDAMAVFTFKFQRVPEIQRWLQTHAAPQTSSLTEPEKGNEQ